MRCPVDINTGEFTKQVRTAAVESGIMIPGLRAGPSAYPSSANTSGISTTTTSNSGASGAGSSSSDGGGIGTGAVAAASASSATPSSSLLSRGSGWVARHFGVVNAGVPVLLNTVSVFHRWGWGRCGLRGRGLRGGRVEVEGGSRGWDMDYKGVLTSLCALEGRARACG